MPFPCGLAALQIDVFSSLSNIISETAAKYKFILQAKV